MRRILARSMFKSKIHRATVTHADLHYEGSVTLDRDLLEASDILPYEEVHVWNVTRGTRLSTYALEGERGSGVVCMNGAAAHLCQPGDIIIIATFAPVEEVDVRAHRPTVVLVDEQNRIKHPDLVEVPGPQRREVALPANGVT
jgi:aspartate 1-decarboxylase